MGDCSIPIPPALCFVVQPDGTTRMYRFGARYQSLSALDPFQRHTSRFDRLSWVAYTIARAA